MPGSESSGPGEGQFHESNSHAVLNGPWETLSSARDSSILVMELEF